MKLSFRTLAAGLLAAAVAFVSCDQAEVDDLQKQIDELTQKVEELSKTASSGAVDIPSLKTEVAALKQIVESYNTELKAKIDAAKADQQAQFEALNAKYAELNAALAAAKAELQNKLDALSTQSGDLQSQITAAINDYTAMVNAAVSDFNAALAEIKAKDSAQDVLIANLQATCDALAKQITSEINALKSNIDGDINALMARLSTAEDNYSTLSVSLETLRSEVQATISVLMARIAAAEEAIQTLEKTIGAMEMRIASAEAGIATCTSDVEALKLWKETTAAAISNMQAMIAALSQTAISQEDFDAWTETAIAQFATKDEVNALTALFNQFKELANGKFGTLETQIAQMQDAIDLLMASVSGGDASLTDLIASLQATDEDLADQIMAARQEFIDQYAKIAEEYAAYVNAAISGEGGVIDYVDESLAGVRAELINVINQIQASYQAADKALQDQINGIVGRIAALEQLVNEHNSLIKELDTLLKESYGDLITRINNAYSDLNGQIAALDQNTQNAILEARDQAQAALNEVAEGLNESISTLADMVQARLDYIEQVIDELYADLWSILDRVQSITFVPRYQDGLATIDYTNFYGRKAAMDSVLEYEVRPYGLAVAIAQACKYGGWGYLENYGSFYMSYVLEKVGVRSELDDVISYLGIDEVGVNETGSRLLVTVRPEGLDSRFFDGDPDYQFAGALQLQFEPENASNGNYQELTTAYVGFAGKEHTYLHMGYADWNNETDSFGDDTETQLYVGLDQVFEMFNLGLDSMPYFQIDGVGEKYMCESIEGAYSTFTKSYRILDNYGNDLGKYDPHPFTIVMEVNGHYCVCISNDDPTYKGYTFRAAYTYQVNVDGIPVETLPPLIIDLTVS